MFFEFGMLALTKEMDVFWDFEVGVNLSRLVMQDGFVVDFQFWLMARVLVLFFALCNTTYI